MDEPSKDVLSRVAKDANVSRGLAGQVARVKQADPDLARIYLLPKHKEAAKQRQGERTDLQPSGQESGKSADSTEREAHYQAGARLR